MGLFRKSKNMERQARTVESLERAEKDLKDQEEKRKQELALNKQFAEAFKYNHFAEKLFDAFATVRQDTKNEGK